MRHPTIAHAGLAALALSIAGLAGAPMYAHAGHSAQDPGQAIFQGKGNCFTCHGREGKGTPLAPDLTDAEWLGFDGRPTAEEVSALIREGVPKPVRHPAPMPPMGGARLSDEELGQVAAWVLSLSQEAGAPDR